MDNRNQHMNMLSSRRLIPTELRERNEAMTRQKLTSNHECDHFLDKKFANVCAKGDLSSTLLINTDSIERHAPSPKHVDNKTLVPLSPRTMMNKKALKPHHVAIQKRVRYKHLIDPSNNKALPRDGFDEPLVYQRGLEINKATATTKKKAPLSLNPILNITEYEVFCDSTKEVNEAD